ncbi:MAG: hypothetical protein RLZZ385_302 [Pseudomonadota bacterium]|jgi:catechol 2,3-dioxygenase-like lactoylglutathione lyase family enzyme
MLAHAKLQAILLSADLDRSEGFYCGLLELPAKQKSAHVLVLDVGGCDLRVSKIATTAPSEHTVLGFAVGDLDTVVGGVTGRGIRLERFEQFSQAGDGTLTTPQGDRVAWFRDPDGNLLSVVQYAGPAAPAP